MQLQEFAKQVLFGTTLDEKLSCPREKIIDTKPGNPIKTPQHLPRPSHLALRSDGKRATHPRSTKLIDERERGRLLHFFGNHELLATELMALVLLKFPDAPASFRLGVLDTLKEEQIHTRLYIHRMKQCGVEFGQLPLSDYFWKSVSSMEDPLDYVTRLSLTFEQANLDYSCEYKSIFESVGDTATANLLDRIYRDEISHVGFGLKWFRRWKASGKSDWEAFRERLVFPLSPSRAKGNDFNRDARTQAGLDDAFINDLRIFHQSRGRTPSILWFNPDSETYAAKNSADGYLEGPSPLQRDLEILPLFYSRRDDILVFSRTPSPTHLRSLQKIGFALPEILEVASGSSAPRMSRKIESLRPWSWTPDSVSFFQSAWDSQTKSRNLEDVWNDSIRELFSKSWSARRGRELSQLSEGSSWTAPPETYGQPASDVRTVMALRESFRQKGYTNVVCKAPFSTAARGNRLILETDEISGPTLRWLEEIWETQNFVIVEPWLERVFDFSIQLESQNGNLRVVGYTRLVNNYRGQFKGIVTSPLCSELDKEITRLLMAPKRDKPRIYQWYQETVGPRLAESLNETGYEGPLGIDAFVYRSPAGELRLKSVVEINPRYTMGRVAHELGKRNAARTVGYFQLLTRSQLGKSQHPTFEDYTRKLIQSHPVRLSSETPPRILSGSFPLNDPCTAQTFLALYHVRNKVGALPLSEPVD